MQTDDLRPPSFRKGRNAIAGVPSRAADGRLWILRGSATSTGLTAMAVATAAMPTLLGLAMADHRPAMLMCFGAAAAILLCMAMAHLRGWDDFLVADSTRRVVITTRMRRALPLWLVQYEPGWSCRVELVRRVKPVPTYYRHYRLKPGDIVEHPHGPATVNEVLHEVRLVGRGCRAERLVPGGEPPGSRRTRGDAVPPLISMRYARPGQVEQLRELTTRLASFLGIVFTDRSDEQSEFERGLPEDSPGIEHVAMPMPGENAARWAGARKRLASPD
ncbi:MAG: hypothetical protein PVH68_02740 [Armatimonadota bacterium]|jgi:hypothetical protein